MGLGTLNKLAASPIQTPSTPEQYNALVDALAGTIISRDPTTGVETDGAYDIGETSNGRPKDINFTGDLIQAGNVVGVAVPVGAIIAWHKSLPGVPATLPANFHECDGTVISEPLSPMNGQTLPNLNSDGRFLRGGTTSGTLQSSQNKSHSHGPGTLSTNHGSSLGHDMIGLEATSPAGSLEYGSGVTFAYKGIDVVSGTTDISIAGTPDESRPDNISMVWIMRIY
jgi:hypothetical protein